MIPRPIHKGLFNQSWCWHSCPKPWGSISLARLAQGGISKSGNSWQFNSPHGNMEKCSGRRGKKGVVQCLSWEPSRSEGLHSRGNPFPGRSHNVELSQTGNGLVAEEQRPAPCIFYKQINMMTGLPLTRECLPSSQLYLFLPLFL